MNGLRQQDSQPVMQGREFGDGHPGCGDLEEFNRGGEPFEHGSILPERTFPDKQKHQFTRTNVFDAGPQRVQLTIRLVGDGRDEVCEGEVVTRGSGSSTWAGRLLQGDGVVAYLGAGAVADAHAHDAIQIVWSFEEAATVRVDDQQWTASVCIVPAAALHSFRMSSGPLALLLVEPHGRHGRRLQEFAIANRGVDLAPMVASLPRPAVTDSPEQMMAWCHAVICALAAHEAVSADVRRPEVDAVLDYVAAELHAMPRLSVAAKLANLSPTRLTHLFSAEVGMPFRRYVLWARMERVVAEVQRGRDLTTAAAAAGFADSAHFSRVFRSMFGLTPSVALPRLEIVRRVRPASEQMSR